MADSGHDERSRFLFLVIWRREKELPTEDLEVWRGSIRMVAADDEVLTHVPTRWFQHLDDLPLVLRRIIHRPAGDSGSSEPSAK